MCGTDVESVVFLIICRFVSIVEASKEHIRRCSSFDYKHSYIMIVIALSDWLVLTNHREVWKRGPDWYGYFGANADTDIKGGGKADN